MPRILEVMAQEGVTQGEDLEEQLFSGQGGPVWDQRLNEIYDTEAMHQLVFNRFETELADTNLSPLLEFFEGDTGAQIIELEISARIAFLDDSIEAAAERAAAALPDSDPERFEALEEFIEVNDLVESNVIGAMNSNLAFYQGLLLSGPFGNDLTESQILADVRSREDGIRRDTQEWVLSYLGLAYSPIPLDDLRAYTSLSRTPEGRALNNALFAAFDEMYTGISQNLGAAAAAFMVSENL